METDVHVPHGLWARDYKDMLAQIKGLGYNVIRLPFSVQALRSPSISSVNFSLGSNQSLQGKTPLQVMDLVIQESNRLGLLIYSIAIDWVTTAFRNFGTEMGGFTEADWINTWTMLASRY
ncbi:hypothetical protein DO97_16290 [Neosynechococcus sphagnicola sy1]|uniref:cellulase n=1 Tax=Neosynechococcus sphagnicola sy1 TaxID=1497020 RepID=A0A098TGH5_9CYAN|nr:cellulase family glycosylhydrolase [Neosynechococcus sphagnicola]KGF71675.1 hypothetical protein DO97_16290 [Neosynechococcus sphagnicola sy1]